jgi:hypothetical protein
LVEVAFEKNVSAPQQTQEKDARISQEDEHISGQKSPE